MSTPDARLSAAERAALADLEAAAAAADPGLAARLKGRASWGLHPALRALHLHMLHRWAALLRARWWGLPMTLAGLLLMVIGLGAGIALSFAGAVLAGVGLRVLAEMAQTRLGPRDPAG